jgi:hypothetical protein
MWYPELTLNQINRICFVLVDASYTEVPGIGNAFNLFISKNGGVFNPSAAAKAEIGNGWYTALLPAAECDTIGPVSVYATHALIVQQNMEYLIQQRNSGCRSFAYTVTNTVTLLPMAGVEVWFSTDFVVPPANIVWYGVTDAFGVARDTNGNVPCLDDGVYAVWKVQTGYTPDFWPDTETVGP